MDRSLSDRASDVYDTLVFDSSRFYNNPAPDEWVSFTIAGVLSAITLIYYVVRVRRIRRGIVDQTGQSFSGSLRLRAYISAYIDVDDPAFTTVKFASQSFFFLGGIQFNYEVAFIAMIVIFTFESSFDTVRVLLAYREVNSLEEYTPISNHIRRKARNTTQLQPTNVYEDLTRGKAIVLMVFITQCLLISFVVYDVYDNPLHTGHDGTSGLPVGGTMGSWWFYVLGVFMATVFLLGPKTAFGQSEQNPAFWLKLLVMAKQDVLVSWYDPVADQILQFKLQKRDWRIWIRLIMSFTINGVGFHVLVHALPIQVAAQSSLTGVVFRAVGMMYLVDLDDVPGYKITLVEDVQPDTPPEDVGSTTSLPVDANSQRPTSVRPTPIPSLRPLTENQQVLDFGSSVGSPSIRTTATTLDEQEIMLLAQKVVDDAKATLDALLEGRRTGDLTVTGALALASGLAGGGVGRKQSKTDFPTNMQDGDLDFQSERTHGGPTEMHVAAPEVNAEAVENVEEGLPVVDNGE